MSTMPTASEVLSAAASLRQWRTLDMTGLPKHRRPAVSAAIADANRAASSAADVLDRVFQALVNGDERGLSRERRWLASQLLDESLTDGEAMSIVANYPSIREPSE
jgi:hypothetical protein